MLQPSTVDVDLILAVCTIGQYYRHGLDTDSEQQDNGVGVEMTVTVHTIDQCCRRGLDINCMKMLHVGYGL